ncbi:hypothetical protein TSUD_42110 [Trifolium subterraneum]|uniref:Uncharacterized protein n=1 Tax=Trifolium subterraneum TaxID=3900 RepID=A0A2Z6M371_TRISU|nr:hypothetical protein TSUD_42110 [Trifolium subterraneum]
MACYFLEEPLLKCFGVESTKATIGSEMKPLACANTIVTPDENSSSICQESSQYDADPQFCQLITDAQTNTNNESPIARGGPRRPPVTPDPLPQHNQNIKKEKGPLCSNQHGVN